MRFDSKVEARYYEHLKALQADGDVEYFLRQVPLHLPGGVVLRVDFMAMWWDDSCDPEVDAWIPRYIDVKGHITPEFKIKKRIAEATYPIKIEVVKWRGKRWIYE